MSIGPPTRQETTGHNVGGLVTSFALTLPMAVLANSSFHVMAAGLSTSTTLGCSDNLNGSYGAALDTIVSVAGGQTNAQWQFSGSAAGTLTVTVTSSVATTIAIWIKEIAGTLGYDSAATPGHSALEQANPGTAPNAVGSGNCVPSVQPGLISGFAAEVVGTAGYSPGTGFTQGLYNDNTMTESYRYTSTAATYAAFTDANGATGNSVTFAALFKEAPFSITATGVCGSSGIAQIANSVGTVQASGVSGSYGVALGNSQSRLGTGSGSMGVANLYSATTGSIFFSQGLSGSLGVVSLTAAGTLNAAGISGSAGALTLTGMTALQAVGLSASGGISALFSINPGAIQAAGFSGSMAVAMVALPTGPMPNLSGQLLDDALEILQQVGFLNLQKIGYFGTYPVTVIWVPSILEPSTVISQSVVAGAQFTVNMSITLTVSEFPISVAFP